MFAKLTKDIEDESGDSNLHVPAGTIVNILSDENGYYLTETLDGAVSFALDYDEVEITGEGK